MLGLLNFLVLQWLGVRLARVRNSGGYWISTGAGEEFVRPLPDEWTLLRWVWPLTGWWSPLRWIRRSP